MDRATLQKLTKKRLADAKALLAAKRWGAAYYLAGYAVECALKACILVRVTGAAELIFADKRFSEKCWTHNLVQLVEMAGLKSTFAAARGTDSDLARYWEIVKDWTEQSRYDSRTKTAAEDLYAAITDKKHGVLSWIQRHW